MNEWLPNNQWNSNIQHDGSSSPLFYFLLWNSQGFFEDLSSLHSFINWKWNGQSTPGCQITILLTHFSQGENTEAIETLSHSPAYAKQRFAISEKEYVLLVLKSRNYQDEECQLSKYSYYCVWRRRKPRSEEKARNSHWNIRASWFPPRLEPRNDSHVWEPKKLFSIRTTNTLILRGTVNLLNPKPNRRNALHSHPKNLEHKPYQDVLWSKWWSFSCIGKMGNFSHFWTN